MSVPTNLGQTSTYSFSPSAAEIILYAFSLINIRPTELNSQHYFDAGMASNLACIDLSNRNPHRFALETIAQPITSGTATYTLPTRTLAVSIVTIATGSGSTLAERTIGPISAYEYQAIPTKNSQSAPTSYFFSLTKTPTISFWPTPDSATSYVANIQTFRQLQDVDLTNLQGVDSPYRYLDALATGIAARLADSYQPAKSQGLYALYENRAVLAQRRDLESTPISIVPGLSSYFRL